VGLAAVQWATAAGLKVLATGGTESGRQLLREQGAHEVFDHHAGGYAAQIREATAGQGVNVIVEMLANANLGKDLTLLAASGRVVVVGSRGPVEINPRDAMAREADIRGVMLGGAPAADLATAHRAIGEGLRNGSLQPVIAEQFPLAEAPAAHQAVMASGARGKITLVL
jgi:NADPH2:quinone reductase